MDIELHIDHPIIWKNVAKLSFFIIVMVSIMHFIGDGFGLSREISTLIISFFEAHAVLAAIMFEWSLGTENIELLEFIFLILLGNTLSKSYLAYQGRNLVKKWPFIFFIFANLIISVIVTVGWIYLTKSI